MKKNSETRRKSIFLNLLRSSDAKNGNYIVVQLFLYTKRDKNKDFLGESLISQSCDASEVRLNRF